MAVTSIWPVKGTRRSLHRVLDYASNPEKVRDKSELTGYHQIRNVLQYAADELKTERRELVSLIGLSGEENAAREMWETKTRWSALTGADKTAGRVCYHGYQSFAAGEVDALAAHKIGVALAERLWGNRFQVVVATHCNTGHYHNHFVINSVSDIDGLKFYNSKEDYRRMREESDRLCREYGLSVIEKPRGKGRDYSEHLADGENRPTVRRTIRLDLDEIIRDSHGMEDFKRRLSERGYELITEGRSGVPLAHPKVRPPGSPKCFRLDTLDAGRGRYTLDAIEKRIADGEIWGGVYDETKSPYYGLKEAEERSGGVAAVFFRYTFTLNVAAYRVRGRPKIPYALREDVKKLQSYSRQAAFIAKRGLRTLDDLSRCEAELRERLDKLRARRQNLNAQNRVYAREGDTERININNARLEEINGEAGRCREELRLCGAVRERSEAAARNLAEYDRENGITDRAKREREMNDNGRD